MNVIQQTILQWKTLLLQYKFALDEMNTKLNILNQEFQQIHHHNPIEHLKSRVKSPESIQKKLYRKGVPITPANVKEHVRDIAGIRITCSFVTDIYQIVEMIQKQDDIEVIEVKDYIQQPKENGYKSLHLVVSIPVFMSQKTEKVVVEIQIRTIAMDFWASLEHKIYYKFNKEIPLSLQNELKEAADMISMLDSKMLAIHTEVEQIKENEKDEKQMEEEWMMEWVKDFLKKADKQFS
ncbi:GTP pyrophosphokinase [Bacillus coahuilensis m2-6]|uniref:GTP pyrophosphokinase n=1 Tax=Bacillus coahuilensis TaxID=408580 RepID=UPI000750184E|nr:GTP pyrophosphokinase family protein [Bacillus coahuilensis]KUP09826.1 GTP pyrophosphokinase [Bacillus coahuilensis m2-6]